jgi:hypothetical protein
MGDLEEVDGDVGLLDECVHEKQWEIGIHHAETSDEVVFPCRSFSCTPMVHAWGEELIVHFFFCHEVFENGAGFIAEALQTWVEAAYY